MCSDLPKLLKTRSTNFMKLRKLEMRKVTSGLGTVGLFFKACFLPSILVTFSVEVNPTMSPLGPKEKKNLSLCHFTSSLVVCFSLGLYIAIVSCI